MASNYSSIKEERLLSGRGPSAVLSEVGIKEFKGNFYGIVNLDHTASKEQEPPNNAKNEKAWDEIF